MTLLLLLLLARTAVVDEIAGAVRPLWLANDVCIVADSVAIGANIVDCIWDIVATNSVLLGSVNKRKSFILCFFFVHNGRCMI